MITNFEISVINMSYVFSFDHKNKVMMMNLVGNRQNHKKKIGQKRREEEKARGRGGMGGGVYNS